MGPDLHKLQRSIERPGPLEAYYLSILTSPCRLPRQHHQQLQQGLSSSWRSLTRSSPCTAAFPIPIGRKPSRQHHDFYMPRSQFDTGILSKKLHNPLSTIAYTGPTHAQYNFHHFQVLEMYLPLSMLQMQVLLIEAFRSEEEY